jgi:hypothetical protein
MTLRATTKLFAVSAFSLALFGAPYVIVLA